MKTVIVDVRTPKEFSEGAFPGALNLPHSNFDVNHFSKYRNDNIALVCFSGGRAQKVKELLEMEGFQNVSILQYQMVNAQENTNSESKMWSVDRQFRITLGLILAIFMLLNYALNSSIAFVLLFGVFSGLMYSSITDNCYLKSLIAIMPWNKTNKLDVAFD